MSGRRRHRLPVRLFLTVAVALAASLAVAACETPKAVHVEAGEAGEAADNLKNPRPLPGFTPRRLPTGWIFDGAGETAMEGITVAGEAGVPALKVVSGSRISFSSGAPGPCCWPRPI
jgi:hypothetical protein